MKRPSVQVAGVAACYVYLLFYLTYMAGLLGLLCGILLS